MTEYGKPKENLEKAPQFSIPNIQQGFLIAASGVIIIAGINYIINLGIVAKTSSVQSFNGFKSPSSIAADKVENPVQILLQAGAIPNNGAVKGEYSADGYWFARGSFPASSEGNKQVGAYTQFYVNSYPSRQLLEKAIIQNADAITDDYHKVLIGYNRYFYAVITAIGGANGPEYDVNPEAVAAKLNASIRP